MAKAHIRDSKRLANIAVDCWPLLTHLVRQNGPSPKSDHEARSILRAILKPQDGGPPRLRAGTAGWYSTCSETHSFDPRTLEFKGPNLSKVVCFTESPLTGLEAHRDVFNAKYGIAFKRDHLLARGANPCLDIGDRLLKSGVITKGGNSKCVYNFIPAALQPFVNIINDTFDATHEREWRYVGDLGFEIESVALIFCPEADFEEFAVLQRDETPIVCDLHTLETSAGSRTSE